MIITPMQPLVAVDWDKIDVVRVTLEKPFKGGGLRWRQGTSAPKRNLNFNAHDPTSGPVFWPGAPIMYPEESAAVAGDAEHDAFLMPLEAACTAFGYFFAPLEVPKNGIIGFTLSSERSRVAAFWNWYKMPPGDGTMHPPMNRVGPPEVPRVAIRPLTKNLQPVKIDGEEVVIRPFAFFGFDDATMYDTLPGEPAANADVAQMLSGFTAEEIDALRELVKVKRGKA